MWRRSHTNLKGRHKGWKQVHSIEKNEGYRGLNLWRDGKRHYSSVRQFRRLLQRNPSLYPFGNRVSRCRDSAVVEIAVELLVGNSRERQAIITGIRQI
jgi:hypothetical protein